MSKKLGSRVQLPSNSWVEREEGIMEVRVSASSDCPMIKVAIGEKKNSSTWLVDSGARESVMDNESFKEKFPGTLLEPLPPTIRFKTADGSPLDVLGSFSTQFWFAGLKEPVQATMYVCRGVTRTRLIGVNILSQFPCWGVDNRSKCFTIGEIRIPLITTAGEAPSASSVQLVRDVTVPPRCSRFVSVSLPSRYRPTEFIFKPSMRMFDRHKLLLPICLVANNFFDGTVSVKVTNPSESEVTVNKGTKVGIVLNNVKDYDFVSEKEGGDGPTISMVRPDSSVQDLMKELRDGHPELFKLYEGSCEILGESEKRQLLEMFIKYRHVFSMDDDDIGATNVIRHKIVPKSSKVIYRRQYRHTEEQHKEIDKQVKKLLDTGVIKESMSPFNSPVLMVPKKEAGKWRFCLDCRYINDLTEDQYFPIPRVDDVMDCLTGATVYGSADMTSGYHQVEMDPEAAEMTAFSTRKGHFQYERMPMGLRGSGMTFQKMVTLLLSGMLHSEVLAYLDDCVIFSKTVQQHMGTLEEVLRRFGDANLKLKPRKCSFFQRQIVYLGFLVDKHGIRPNPERTKLISELREPRDVKEVQMFLGKANYYRKFIPKLAEIAHPLYELTKTKARSQFVWEAEHQAAFDQIKSILVSGKVMGHPDFSRPFVLDVDASDFALGAELSQEDDKGDLRPIYYASRHLEKSERNYSATARETLAAVFGCEYFRQYLQGRRFLLRTDHNPLVWLRGMREPKRPYSGWIVRLEQFDYQMQYRPGKDHVNADYNSRIRPISDESGQGQISVGTQTEEPEDSAKGDLVFGHRVQTTGDAMPSECNATPGLSLVNHVGSRLHTTDQFPSECNSTPELESSGERNAAPEMTMHNHERCSLHTEDQVPSECNSASTRECNSIAVVELEDVQAVTRVPSGSVSTVDLQQVQTDAEELSPQILKSQQVDDADIGPVIQKLQGGDVALTRAGEQLWRVRKSLEVKEGLLIRRHKLKAGLQAIDQIVLPRCLREPVLECLHDSEFAGHFGEQKTLARVKLRYYWPGYMEDVGEWCKTCDVCQRRKNPKSRNVAPLTSIDAGKGPFEHIALDLLKLPLTERGNQYLLVIEDFFSKWIEAFPLQRTAAPSVAHCLLNGWIARFGCPYSILSDQGREFESRLFKALNKLLQCKKLRTTTYHPRTDGMVERSNRTVIDVLSKYGESEPNWDLHMPLALFAIRTSEHATTGFSPFSLTYGREARIPWDIVYGSAPHTLMPLEKWVAEKKEHMTKVFKMVQQHTHKRQLQQKRYFDSNRRGEFQGFEEGELVMVFDPACRSKDGKLCSPWAGPHRVVSKLSEALYKVELGLGKERVVNVEKLKKYHQRGRGVVERQCHPQSEGELSGESDLSDDELSSDGEDGDDDAVEVVRHPANNQGNSQNAVQQPARNEGNPQDDVQLPAQPQNAVPRGQQGDLGEPLMGARGQYWCNLDPKNVVEGGRRNRN